MDSGQQDHYPPKSIKEVCWKLATAEYFLRSKRRCDKNKPFAHRHLGIYCGYHLRSLLLHHRHG